MKYFLVFGFVAFNAVAGSTPLMGVANSSFQVEGYPKSSDWYDWTHTAGKIADGTNADIATDFWHRYSEDFQLAKELGSNAFRLSIAWERVEPTEGKFDQKAIDHYKKIITSMRAYGLEPVVTLHHFVLPTWLAKQGGLLAPNFADKFAKFSRRMGAALVKAPMNVKYWITINEPMIQVLLGYQLGAWPPGLKDDRQAAMAAKSLAKAHIYSARALRSLGKKGLLISIAHHWRVYEPSNFLNPVEHLYAKVANDRSNLEFVRSILSGNLDFGILGGSLERIKETVKLQKGEKTLDFLGMNYYGRTLLQFQWGNPPVKPIEGPGVKTDLGWEIHPQGFKQSLEDAYREFKLPILVTENGLADAADANRCRFIHDHFDEMKKAIANGVPVWGYLHWSLTDNFEWVAGLTPRFGIVEIDYRTQNRKPRASFKCLEEEFSQW